MRENLTHLFEDEKPLENRGGNLVENDLKNALADENSPYLQQYAKSPVQWHPWGQAAFDLADREEKPIFLSIGYATCHLCHVMGEESFAHPQIAELINASFIAIKIDREELPEVDSFYSEFGESLLGTAAGWPLNVFLTAHLEPFFAANYLLPFGSEENYGLFEILVKIQEIWQEPSLRQAVIAETTDKMRKFQRHFEEKKTSLPTEAAVERAASLLFSASDATFGGLKGFPKFPLSYQTLFLLAYFKQSQDNRAIFLAEKNLTMMGYGAIYDQIGGGIFRYSNDAAWQRPHFEKTLCDNALAIESYLELWKMTQNGLYCQLAEEIISYLKREMQSASGGFFSAQGAIGKGEDFYAWSKAEISALLGENTGSIFARYYHIGEEKIVPYRTLSLVEFAATHRLQEAELSSLLEKGRHLLLQERMNRQSPFKDCKILATGNGLIVHALAKAAIYLGRKEYLTLAKQTATFIRNHLWQEGTLYRCFYHDVKHQGCLDDYAFLIRAFLTLFEAGKAEEDLKMALDLTERSLFLFKRKGGGFYQTSLAAGPLYLKTKCRFADGALPSGNSIQAENLVRLYQITGNCQFLAELKGIFKGASYAMSRYPLGYCYMHSAFLNYRLALA